MATIQEIAAKLRDDYRELRSWNWVARENGISKGMAFRIALRDYEPKDSRIRHRLGLPVYRPAPACNECGEVHTIEGICTKVTQIRIVRQRPRVYRDWWAVPKKELRQMLEERG